jgi:N-acetylglucosamine kinase-like BadF-type ATPase
MSHVLGLDGGGTKTLIALADRSGAVVKLASGASLDPTAATDWPARLSRQLSGVTEGQGAPAAAVLGLSFHGEIKAFTAEQEEVAARLLPASRVIVDNDVRIAFDGAFASGGGVLLLAGTGSMVWASRNGLDDPHHRIGGWGDAFGDEGSAYWIGREALALVSQALDGRSPEALDFANGVLAELTISGDALIDWVYSLKNHRTAIAGVARITARLASAGSEIARAILDRACDHLAGHARVAEKLLSPPGEHRLPWSYAGGVFSNAFILEGVKQRLGSEPVEPMLPPIGGAVLRAARLAGWDADTAFVETLKASLHQVLQSKKQ